MFPLVLNYLLKCELEISFPQIQVKSGLLIYVFSQFSSVQFSPSIMSNALRSHGLQHARLSCPSAAPGVYSNSCPLSRCCHPSIVSSIFSFSFRLQSFPASESFLVSQFFASGGQNNGVSASVLVLTMNTTNDFLQDGLIGYPCSPRDSQDSFPHHITLVLKWKTKKILTHFLQLLIIIQIFALFKVQYYIDAFLFCDTLHDILQMKGYFIFY